MRGLTTVKQGSKRASTVMVLAVIVFFKGYYSYCNSSSVVFIFSQDESDMCYCARITLS